jgi:hypothetical protein
MVVHIWFYCCKLLDEMPLWVVLKILDGYLLSTYTCKKLLVYIKKSLSFILHLHIQNDFGSTGNKFGCACGCLGFLFASTVWLFSESCRMQVPFYRAGSMFSKALGRTWQWALMTTYIFDYILPPSQIINHSKKHLRFDQIYTIR